ncbi:hypothetical protein [uncultured Gimesia sp.]
MAESQDTYNLMALFRDTSPVLYGAADKIRPTAYSQRRDHPAA